MAVMQETSNKLSTKDLLRSLIQSGQLDVADQAAAAQKWLLRVSNSRADYPVGWMTTIINHRSGRIRSVLKKDPVLGPNDQVLMTYRLELQSRHKNRLGNPYKYKGPLQIQAEMIVTMWTRYGKSKSSTVTMNLDTEPRRRVVTSAYLDLEIRLLFLEAHDRYIND